MAVDKKNAARKAAAKHSTNPVLAAFEYAKLTGRLDLVTTQSGREKLQDEMLSIVPPYRHPANNELAEYMIFFDPDCIMVSGMMIYKQPGFIEALDKKGVTDDILTAIKEYVRESELHIIELAKCKDELGELSAIFSEAQLVYDVHRDERSDKRNALVVQAIGLSTGFAPKRVDEKKIYFDYVKLVRKKGLSRDEAVEAIRRTYDLASGNAAIKFLTAYRKSILEKWKRSHASIYPEIEKRLKRLIPRKIE